MLQTCLPASGPDQPPGTFLDGFSYIEAPAALPDGALRAVADYWNRRRGGRAMPRRADIDPLDLKEHLSKLFLVDVLPEAWSFRYRLVGTELVAGCGRDFTGLTLRAIASSLTDQARAAEEWLIERYRTVALDKVPVLTLRPMVHVNKEHLFSAAIHLPLSDDGERVNMVFGAVQFARNPAAFGASTLD